MSRGTLCGSALVALVFSLCAHRVDAGPLVTRLRLVDANGRAMGILFESPHGGDPVVYRREGGLIVLVPVHSDGSGFGSVGGNPPFFETTDCSGPMYVDESRKLYRYALPPPGAAPPYTVFYYAGDPIAEILFQSHLQPSGDCLTVPTPYLRPGGPAKTLDLSDYTPPFRLK